jgi:preprotein translocase subunit SecF
LNEEYKGAKQEEFSTIGPTIGKETAMNAVKATVIASLLIVIYISLVFRKVPKPASSIRFGVSAIIALIHDVLVVLGVFSILGYIFNVEIDALFVTALLTIIGFSVHDTIVVFDRIRENLGKGSSENFPKIVNDSILQTIGRSLNTSITVLLVLFALLLFGGESIRWFVVALMVGVASGTYSSIFNASPILVVWHEWSVKRAKNK